MHKGSIALLCPLKVNLLEEASLAATIHFVLTGSSQFVFELALAQSAGILLFPGLAFMWASLSFYSFLFFSLSWKFHVQTEEFFPTLKNISVLGKIL